MADRISTLVFHFFVITCSLFLSLAQLHAKIPSQLSQSPSVQEPIQHETTTHLDQTLPEKQERPSFAPLKKDFTVLVYAAGVNNLGQYLPVTLMQMEAVGGSSNFNLVAQVDKLDEYQCKDKWLYKKYVDWARETGYPPLNVLDTPQKRPHEENSSIIRIEAGNGCIHFHEALPKTVTNASGTRTSLYEFLAWGIKKFPADNYVLVIWNHGSGYLEAPQTTWNNSPEVKNPEGWPYEKTRGIAFNETQHVYLSNQYLTETLDLACTNLLGGKKFAILGLDACLMSMAEYCALLEPYAHYLVASQEVGWGWGWNYAEAFRPLSKGTLSPRDLAIHIVESYKKEMLGDFVPEAYKKYHRLYDFTLAALDLAKTNQLIIAINNLSKHLKERLEIGDQRLRNTLRAVRSNSALCTWFYENNYIDLFQFCESLHNKLPNDTQLMPLLNAVEVAIITIVIKNVHSPITLPHVRGVSIYFPPQRIQTLYEQSPFTKKSSWPSFLQTYRQTILSM